MALEIQPALPADLFDIRAMLNEYAESVGVDLCFQGFAKELAELPGDYASPAGTLLIARIDGQAVGMVALRNRTDGRSEMKRLYVRPAARRSGLGRLLVERIVDEARRRRYPSIVLDTLPVMQAAQRLYAELGFVDMPPYYESPIAGTRFMERVLPDARMETA